jgi:hypothetical protein
MVVFQRETSECECDSQCISGWAMRVKADQFQYFGGWKWFGERTDGAEFFRFSENLFTTMCRNENDRYFRLMLANAGDHLEAGDVC